MKDKSKLIKHFDGYKSVAKKMGTETQEVLSREIASKIKNEDLKVIIADIDTSQMDPKTVKMLNKMGVVHRFDGMNSFMAFFGIN